MDSNLVSVIIPVFNRFDLALKSIESVLNQTYSNFEIILVDDCSTEGVFSIDAQNVLVYRLNENSGPGVCRQFGREKSEGKYILFLDSDDILEPTFLEKSIEKHLYLDNTVSFTYCHSGILGSNLTWNKTDIEYNCIFPTLLEGRQWPTSALLWNRDFLPDWGNFRTWEDYDIEFKASLTCNKIGYVAEKLVLISPPSENSLSGQVKDINHLNCQWEILKNLVKNNEKFDKLLNKNQKTSVWENIHLRKIKLIRDSILLNFEISIENLREITSNYLEFIFMRALAKMNINALLYYIKIKIWKISFVQAHR